MIDLALSDEQEALQRSFRSILERECGAQVVRASEPLGFCPELWSLFCELGVPAMVVPKAAGGSGGDLLDALVVSEIAGAHLAPAPLAESIVTNRLLARIDTQPAQSMLARALDGDAIITLALQAPVGTRLEWVPAGAVADHVVALLDNTLVITTDQPSGRAVPNTGALPLDHRNLDGAQELASGFSAASSFLRAAAEWKILTAGLLWGAGDRSLQLGVEYTNLRTAFGVPIASFQTVNHRLADHATALAGTRLLARKAASGAGGKDDGEGQRLAHMAYAFAAESAEQAATDALHFHGGYGFTLEYDIQLYFRRIKAWSQLCGGQAHELARLADVLWGPS